MKFKILFSIASVMVFSCGEPDYPTPIPSSTSQSGRLLAVNTIPSGATTAIDITVDNVASTPGPLFDSLYYTQSLSYRNIPAGANRLVRYVNNNDGAVRVSDRSAVLAGTSYTSFYYSTISANNAPAIRKITDNLTTPDVGFAHVRFLHFAKDAPPVRVVNAGTGAEVFSSRAYAALGTNNAFTNFTPLAAGIYNLEVRNGDNETVLTIPNANLQSKRIYTIYARGLVGDGSLSYSIIQHN